MISYEYLNLPYDVNVSVFGRQMQRIQTIHVRYFYATSE